MLTRRRVLLIGLAAALLAVLLAAWLLWPGTAITRENAAKIRPGMTLAEVEAILGGPARNDTTGPIESDIELDRFKIDSDHIQSFEPPLYVWQSDYVVTLVLIGPDERVDHFAIRAVRRTWESPLAILRRWLRL